MTKEYVIQILKNHLKIHPLKIKNIYLYGSRCYGTNSANSDWDFIIIANNNVENIEHVVKDNDNNINFHIQTPDYFQSRLDWNDPKTFECLLWSKKNLILENIKFDINIDKAKYRHAVSHISSNSFVKAKKKILQGDIFIGQKSLYHSLRIPMYAIQILKYGDIIDWECANKYWYDIIKIKNYNTLKKKYQPIRNSIMSEFRILCPH